MNVHTEVIQIVQFKDGLAHFRDVEARFFNGHIQWLRWKYRDGSIEYELRVNADGLKEFQKIVNEVAEFLEGPNQNIIGKIEKISNSFTN